MARFFDSRGDNWQPYLAPRVELEFPKVGSIFGLLDIKDRLDKSSNPLLKASRPLAHLTKPQKSSFEPEEKDGSIRNL